MERLANTEIPMSSLMGVRQSIRFDDNSTNVKLQSKKRLEELNDMMLERQQTVHRARMIREDINNNLIKKLRKVLSKKFRLTREEYIVLIDKFTFHYSIPNKYSYYLRCIKYYTSCAQKLGQYLTKLRII